MRCRSLVALAVLTRVAAADELDDRLAARAAKLADAHYRAGEYYRAISGYEELALFAHDDATRVLAAVRIAMSYHRGHQLADAVGRYRAALAIADADTAAALRVQLAIARAERTFDEPGAESLDVVIGELEPAATGDRAIFELARIELLAGRRDAARITAARLPATSALAPVIEHALARPPAAHRSPWLGLGLSAVVPGAGSVYGGHVADGIYYFGLTALAGLGAWDVHDRSRSFGDQKLTFYGLGTLALAFYAGNLIQGYAAVARYNAVTDLDARRALWRDTEQPLPLEP
jgi:hypothetical protein